LTLTTCQAVWSCVRRGGACGVTGEEEEEKEEAQTSQQ